MTTGGLGGFKGHAALEGAMPSSVRRPLTTPWDGEEPLSLAPGVVVAGRYVMLQQLGRGAHGEVWSAHDRVARAPVAVKFLHANGPCEQQARREIGTLRVLRLPGVVRLVDEGVHGGAPFLVMELLSGSPFPGRPAPASWAEIEPAVVATLDVLARIHAAGIVHSDLKPANVLIDAAGRAVVLDFGVATCGAYGDLDPSGLLGTPGYVAPEQLAGAHASPATDLYAFGAMLYQALSGALPHGDVPRHRFLLARASDRPRALASVAVSAPAAVIELVDELLSPRADDRPRSVAEVLRRIRGERRAPTDLLPWLGARAHVVAIAARVAEGRAVDVVGPAGSGRTRAVREALALAGRRALWLEPAGRPLHSLQRLVSGLMTGENEPLEDVMQAARVALAHALDGGAVVVADDLERIDPWSREALAAELHRGAVVRVHRAVEGAAPPPDAVAVPPLAESDLRPLFAGPERVFHFVSDGAHQLHRRTGGVPSRVRDEVAAWTLAGLARWDGDRLVVDREAIERIETGNVRTGASSSVASLRPRAPSAADPLLDDLLAWVALAWPNTDVPTLVAASGLDPARVADGLAQLERAGSARRLGDGRLEIDPRFALGFPWPWDRHRAAHQAVAAALEPGTDGRLLHLLMGLAPGDGAASAVIADEAVCYAERALAEGRTDRALVVLADALASLRVAELEAPAAVAPALERVLRAWVVAVLIDSTPQALDRVYYELVRTTAPSPLLHGMTALVRAALVRFNGGDEPLSVADAVPPFDDAELERRRLEVRVTAAARQSLALHEAALGDLERWVREQPTEVGQASYLRAVGAMRYQKGDFPGAALAFGAAIPLERWRTTHAQLAARAASALVEAGRLDVARARAEEARALAAACRAPALEVRAERVLRLAGYRDATIVACDPELVAVAHAAGELDIAALVDITEAAIAWRAGDLVFARARALSAARHWARSAWSTSETIASALAFACDDGEGDERDAAAIAERAVAHASPDVAMQVLGLLAPRWPAAAALARAWLGGRWREMMESPRRLDVLSLLEARERLDAAAASLG